jgi:hypothetical protein
MTARISDWSSDVCSSDLPIAALGAAVFITDESFTDEGGGMCTFTRVWATVPAGYDDFESYAYAYPAILFRRESLNLTTTSKVAYTYYLAGPGGTVATPNAIPQVEATRFTYGDGVSTGDTFYLSAFSTPTFVAYDGWRTTDAATLSSYSIVAEDSQLERYLGNIWRRTVRSVKAR